MATSDAAANATLDREVSAGGSWWLGLALTMPDPRLEAVVDEAPLARVEVPRMAAFWNPADQREVWPVNGLTLPDYTPDGYDPANPDPDDAFTPVAWVLWDAPTGGTPQRAGRLADVVVTAGSGVFLPAESLTLSHP